MTWEKNTGCRYHTQETDFYCGAACAMMILAEIGVPHTDLDQDDLYASNHNNNVQPDWATDPYGLRFTLNDRKPDGFFFVVHKPTNEAEGTRDIVSTLWKFNVSPACLVFRCMHWIVVRGVRTDVEPTDGTDYTVDGLWINNPIHYALPPPPPHSATDACGSGGALGVGNQFVTYANWRNTYFTGCNYDDPAGSLQFISVCDPEIRDIELPGRRPRKFRADGRRIIIRKDAMRFAEEGIKEYHLHKDKESAKALKGAKPGRAQVVLRLDRPDTYYYLVPWMRDGKTTALSQVDARFGEFQSLQLLETPIRGWLLSRRRVTPKVANRRFEIREGVGLDRLISPPGELGGFAPSPVEVSRLIVSHPEIAKRIFFPEDRVRVVFRPDAYCLAPTLVWKPCRESFSPHLPFYQFTMGDYKLYVRVDGEVFTQLTTTGRGV